MDVTFFGNPGRRVSKTVLCVAMRLLQVWLFLLLGWPTSGSAQPAIQLATGCPDPGSTMLWEVQGTLLEDRDISLHLFGSIHVGKPDLYPLSPVVETSFRKADTLVFEIDPRSASDPQTALQMQLRGLLPAGQRLEQVVSGRTLLDLEAVLGRLDIPLQNFATFKPWMITLMLANLQVNAMGFEAQWGLESWFMAQRDPDTEILELESLEQQVDMLEKLDQDAFLGYSLREYEASAGLFEQMMAAWRCGDHLQLSDIMFAESAPASLTAEEAEKAGLLQEQLYSQRNQVMADGIEQLIATGQGGYFVVVGAGHLLGEDSVPELLVQRGYQVLPVRQSP